MSMNRPAVVVIVLLLIACTVLLAKCVSLVRDKTELEQELEGVRWEVGDRLAYARDFEAHALTVMAEHILPILLSSVDGNLEGNVTIADLIEHAGRGGMVVEKDATDYAPPVIHKEMEYFIGNDLDPYGIEYYLIAGPSGKPFLEAGNSRGYNECRSDALCSLITGTAQEGNVSLMLFSVDYGAELNSRTPPPPMHIP